MKLLLDTHAALWWLAGDERVGEEAAAQLLDDTNQVLLSAAVVWEVAIKRSLGKLLAPDDFATILLGAGSMPWRSASRTQHAWTSCRGITVIPSIVFWWRRPRSNRQRSYLATIGSAPTAYS